MSDLIVVWDREREIATVVDMETAHAVGPVMAGDDAGDILQAFIDATPFDISLLEPDARIAAFVQFLDSPVGSAADASISAAAVALESSAHSGAAGPDADAARAEHEAVNAGDGAPQPAPADTDAALEHDTRQAPAIVECSLCAGTGNYEGGTCPLCNGAGTLDVPQHA